MIFSFKRSLACIAALAIAFPALVACDDDDDKKGGTEDVKRPDNDKQQEGDLGYAKSCTPLGEFDDVNWKVAEDKAGIVDYLVDICKLSEFFQTDEFLKKPTSEQVIGEPCFCFGPFCEMAGYERPELQTEIDKTHKVAKGIIYGCDNVPVSYNGATRACLRSSNVEGIKPAIYFPNGTCILAMSKCTPGNVCWPDDSECTSPAQAEQLNEDTICSFAKFGTYDPEAFTECPNGEVLLDFVMSISIEELHRDAILDVRACLPGCKTNADCKGYDIYDPIVNEHSQYQCVTATSEDGKKAGVCFDMRTTAQNAEGKRDLKLINPGNFEIQ